MKCNYDLYNYACFDGDGAFAKARTPDPRSLIAAFCPSSPADIFGKVLQRRSEWMAASPFP